MKYEIQTRLAGGHWENTLSEDGLPLTFKTYHEATTELNNHLKHCAKQGWAYPREDYKIVAIH